MFIAGFVSHLNRYINYMLMYVTDTKGMKTMLIQYLLAPPPPPRTHFKSCLIFRETGDVVLIRGYHLYYYGLSRQSWAKCEGGEEKKNVNPAHANIVIYIYMKPYI